MSNVSSLGWPPPAYKHAYFHTLQNRRNAAQHRVVQNTRIHPFGEKATRGSHCHPREVNSCLRRLLPVLLVPLLVLLPGNGCLVACHLLPGLTVALYTTISLLHIAAPPQPPLRLHRRRCIMDRRWWRSMAAAHCKKTTSCTCRMTDTTVHGT